MRTRFICKPYRIESDARYNTTTSQIGSSAINLYEYNKRVPSANKKKKQFLYETKRRTYGWKNNVLRMWNPRAAIVRLLRQVKTYRKKKKNHVDYEKVLYWWKHENQINTRMKSVRESNIRE